MKEYALFTNDEELKAIPADTKAELVCGRATDVMLSDIKVMRHRLRIDIYNDELTQHIVLMCAAIQEACLRASECQIDPPIHITYKDITCELNASQIQALCTRAIIHKVATCLPILRTIAPSPD